MPRVGRHPLKDQNLSDGFRSKEITITTITHIPVLEGYWSDSLEVLKLFFESLFAHTELEFDLMVFDNQSCQQVREYLLELHASGKIQYLTLSKYNLRKLGALNYLLSVASGEYVVFADSDVYFLPGWLEASLKVLDAFPEAARVTALPIAGGDASVGQKDSFEAASSDSSIAIQAGHIIDAEYVNSHRISLGKTKEQYQNRLQERKDVLLSRNGVDAFLSGADFQFTIRREALKTVLPLTLNVDSELYYDPIYSPVLEHRLKREGYWLLSSPDYLVHHMGNTVPDLEAELPWLAAAPVQRSMQREKRSRRRNQSPILQNRFVRWFLKRVNVLTYKLLYER